MSWHCFQVKGTNKMRVIINNTIDHHIIKAQSVFVEQLRMGVIRCFNHPEARMIVLLYKKECSISKNIQDSRGPQKS